MKITFCIFAAALGILATGCNKNSDQTGYSGNSMTNNNVPSTSMDTNMPINTNDMSNGMNTNMPGTNTPPQ